MIAVLVGLAMATPPVSRVELKAICQVGRAALRDLPDINANRKFDTYYAAPDSYRRDLLTICPKLKAHLPKGYRIADDDARARASVGAPIPGHYTREASIYSIDVPELNGDFRSATVRMSHSCTGLCGSVSEAFYVRTAKGWRRQGEVRTLSVS